jgi:hypothetical protein
VRNRGREKAGNFDGVQAIIFHFFWGGGSLGFAPREKWRLCDLRRSSKSDAISGKPPDALTGRRSPGGGNGEGFVCGHVATVSIIVLLEELCVRASGGAALSQGT